VAAHPVTTPPQPPRTATYAIAQKLSIASASPNSAATTNPTTNKVITSQAEKSGSDVVDGDD
jgi:hypothetical protein